MESNRNRLWWIGSVIVGVALLVVAGWAVLGQRAPGQDSSHPQSNPTLTMQPTLVESPSSSVGEVPEPSPSESGTEVKGGESATGAPSATSSPIPIPISTGIPTTSAVETPASPRTTLSPLALEETQQAGSLLIELTDIQPVTGQAQLPGEVGGPALAVTVRVTNDSDQVWPSHNAVVNLYFADGVPANSVSAPGVVRWPAQAEPGRSIDATFVFSVPFAERSAIRIEVDAELGAPVVIFEGNAA